MKHLTLVAALVACVLAGAALAVSLMHAGPSGPRGLRGAPGPPGRSVSVKQQHYGICWQSTSGGDGTGYYWVQSVSIDPPQISNGVYQCPQGETFVSIQPLPASTPGP